MDAIPSPKSRLNQTQNPSEYLNFARCANNLELDNNKLHVGNSEQNKSNRSSNSRRSNSRRSKSSSKNLNKSVNHSSKMIVVKPMQISVNKQHQNSQLNVRPLELNKQNITKKFVNPFRITDMNKEQRERDYYSQIWNDKKLKYSSTTNAQNQHKMSNGSKGRLRTDGLDVSQNAIGGYRNSVQERPDKFFQFSLKNKKL